MTFSLGCVLLAAALPSCTRPPAKGEASATQADVHAWKVYDGTVLVLDVSDVPGPILSTATLPPGVPPVKHSFLGASARSARHEHQFHEILTASQNLPDFLNRLRTSGFRVVPVATAEAGMPEASLP